jgi:polysaccharide export outer membrane protein
LFSKKYLIVLAAALVAACVDHPKPLGGDPGVQVLAAKALPPPADADPSGAVNYRIGSFDKLQIDVFGVQDFSREMQVDGSGKIAFPLVGEIQAGGRTVGELATAIAVRLRGKYIRNPQVTVNLKESLSHMVTVDGQVNKPGQYPVTGDMSLIRVVAAAGGTTEFAKLDDVVVFRTVGSEHYLALYNLEGVRRGNYADPRIYADDVVVVGDSAARRRVKDLINASSLLASPIIALVNRL